jgi:hypothetical protein
MNLLHRIRENPVLVLCVALTALIAWLAIDLVKAPPAKKPTAEPLATVDGYPPAPKPRIPAPALDGIQPVALPDPPGNRVVSSLVLPHVKPGMKRVEVENYLGPPTADHIQPVRDDNGRLTYSTTYELGDIDPPMTIRPIQPRRTLPRPAPQAGSAGSVIAFVFDASQPGHPLVDILYPDPLF